MPSFRPLLFLALMLLMGLAPASAQEAATLPNSGIVSPAAPALPPDYFRLQKKILRWHDQTRMVLVHISNASYLPDWQPWNPQIVKDAFGEWQHALNNRLIFVFMDSPAQADIVVNWWDNALVQGNGHNTGQNRTKMWGKYIAQNDLYFSLHLGNSQPIPPNELYVTALHEIGHSLGIQAHSDSPTDIMYPVISGVHHLSQRDINTALRIYASKPDYTNPPGYHLSRFEDFRKTQKGKGGFWIPIILPIPI